MISVLVVLSTLTKELRFNVQFRGQSNYGTVIIQYLESYILNTVSEAPEFESGVLTPTTTGDSNPQSADQKH